MSNYGYGNGSYDSNFARKSYSQAQTNGHSKNSGSKAHSKNKQRRDFLSGDDFDADLDDDDFDEKEKEKQFEEVQFWNRN